MLTAVLLYSVQYIQYLDLHPAAEVVAEEVGCDRVEHVHLVGLEGHGLLVEVVPEGRKKFNNI